MSENSRIPLRMWLLIFESEVRYRIVQILRESEPLLSDEIVTILKDRYHLAVEKPEVFRHLVALQKADILTVVRVPLKRFRFRDSKRVQRLIDYMLSLVED